MKMFYGVLQLRKDPKVERLNIDNLILAGSKIVNTPNITGIVVYAGGNTKIQLNSDYKHRKQLVLQGYLNLINDFTVIIIICLSVISYFVVIARSKTSASLEIYDPEANSMLRSIGFQILYLVFMPMALQ